MTLQDILDLCEYEVSLTINEHKSYYETIDYYLCNNTIDPEYLDIDMEEINRTGNLVCLQAYPNTPGGFHLVYRGTIQSAIDAMYKSLTKE